MVTVTAGQSSEPTSLFGLSQCGSDSGEVTLGCVTAGFSPSNFLKFKWKDAAGKDLSEFTQYPDIEKDGKYSKISQIRVKASDWDANKRFTCELEYPKSDKKFVLSKPEEILHIPTLYLMNPANDELKYNQTATFACLAADFSPPQHTFTWITEENGKKNYTGGLYSFTSPPENGRHTAISYHRVPESVWKKQGTKVTCHFQHKTKNETRSVEYKIDDFDSCTEEEAAQVHIVPPSAKDLFLQKEGYLQCKITGNINDVGKHEDVKWLKGEEEVLEKSEEGVREDNSITFKLKVTFDEWHKGTVFSCEVPHRCYPGGLKISYQREKVEQLQYPSLYVMLPSEDEALENNTATFVCLARDFLPLQHEFHWKHNDNDHTQVGSSWNLKGSVYTASSYLVIPKAEWTSGVTIKCLFEHKNRNYSKEVKHPTGHLSVELTSPSPKDIFLNNKAVLECITTGIDSVAVFAAQVTWKVDGKSKSETMQDKNNKNGLYKMVSKLEASVDDWFSGKEFECLVSDMQNDKVKISPQKRSIKKAEANPNVFIYANKDVPGQDSLVCEVRAPFVDAYIMWQVDGGKYIEGKTAVLKQDDDKMSFVSILTIPSKTSELTVFTCAVKHGGMKNISAPLQATYSKRDLKPSVVLLPPLWKGGEEGGSMARLLCVHNGTNIEEPVEWTIDGKPQIPTENFGPISQLEVDTAKWSKSSNYTCRVKPDGPGMSWTAMKSIQVCSDGHFLAPHVQLEGPRLRDVMAHQVVVICRVMAAISSRVSWWVDNKEVTLQAKEKSEPGGRVTSNLTLALEEWQTLQEVKCKVEHPCYPTEKNIHMSELDKQKPTVTIRRLFKDLKKDNNTVLECLLGDLSTSEVSVTLQANGEDLKEMYVDIPIQKDEHSLTAVRFHIPENQRSENKTFACKLIHDIQAKNQAKISRPTGKLFAPPTIDLLLAPKSSSVKLVCVGSGFHPQLKWKLPPTLKESATSNNSMGEDGRLTVTSKIDIPQKTWYKGLKFGCEVEDQNQTEIRNISICSVVPQSVFAQVYLTGPSLNDTANNINNNVQVTCLVVGIGLSELPIIWKVGGQIISEGFKSLPLSKNDSETQSVLSELSLQARIWHNHTDISCEISRDCDHSALVRHISKAKNMASKTSKDEVLFCDDNMGGAVPEDTVAETLNMAWAFLFLFLSCLLYSCIVTLIKVK